jgi:hypothetical protein
MTTNRPSPEGAWDHDLPSNLEDQASISTYQLLTHANYTLAGKPLFSSKENYTAMMNGEQIGGTIRTLGALLTGWIVGSGLMPAELWAQVVPVVAGLAVWGWSMWSKTTANQISSTAKLDDVKKVVTTSAIAKADQSTKVTAS